MNRREFMGTGAIAGAALVPAPASARAAAPARGTPGPAKFKLGTISYNIGATWDLATLLDACKTTGYETVELRTSHAHKVEPTLGADERRRVKGQIGDSGIKLWGFGTVCEFHSPDPAVVKKNIEDCRAYCQLAHDLGAPGVKVRPNALVPGVEPARTLEQIGRALAACGKTAADLGVEIFVEVHGTGTCEPGNMRTILDHAAHKSVGACWNCNPQDMVDGSIARGFDLLKKDIRACHINELWNGYPYRDLFARLKSIGYDRVTLMEVPRVPELADAKKPEAALRFMRYYKALWTELST